MIVSQISQMFMIFLKMRWKVSVSAMSLLLVHVAVKTGDDADILSVPERGDYYPFSSSESALLYILLNSPRPVVSTLYNA